MRRITCSNSLQAKAEAMKEAINFAVSLGMQDVIFESNNNKTIVETFKGSRTQRLVTLILEDALTHLKMCDPSRFRWVAREANFVADLVAKLSLNRSLPTLWVSSPSVCIRKALTEDLMKPVCFYSFGISPSVLLDCFCGTRSAVPILLGLALALV